ncbi:type II toxin-antitoxin system VapC family toxin [Saccharopolyspora hattusasensis]|uniref:type II toxin-antitoxin system VapC family toxin n=1 Tax=Saccharopolyspora hattusasensis TaxID=1128679 RepID=UPI003D99A5CD
MIVVDSSVMVAALVESDQRGGLARSALATGGRLCAPGHFPLEVVHVIRGLAMAKKISANAASDAVAAFAEFTFRLIPASGALLDRVWELRHNVTAYDAAYVAVAEQLGVPLVTGDVRLAAADGPKCEIRVLR